ncbi:hypothetical protein PS726_04368 [Pseudomonas fluorescens]|nr:hypothetical protein PS726_04368 [Pseudomonas fluorescens]
MHCYFGSAKPYVSGRHIYEGVCRVQRETSRVRSVPLAEGGFDAAQQPVRITGFLQAGNQRRSIGAKVWGHSKISGDEYSGDVEAPRNELLMHLYTAHSRHLDIGNQAVYFSGAVPVEKFQCAAIRSNFITAGPQQAFQGCPNGVVIIDNCNNRRIAYLSVLDHLAGSCLRLFLLQHTRSYSLEKYTYV